MPAVLRNRLCKKNRKVGAITSPQFIPVNQWLGMNMREPVLGQTKGLSTPGSFSDSCRYLQYKIVSKMQWYFLCESGAAQSPPTSLFDWIQALEMCGGVLRIWFYFQYKHLKCKINIIKVHDNIHYFFTWRWDLICSSKNLQVKIVYGNHTQRLFSMSEQKTKANYTLHDFRLYMQTVKSTWKRNATVKKNSHSRNPKNSLAVKYTSFQRFWNGKLFLVYCIYPKTTDLFLWEIIQIMADL